MEEEVPPTAGPSPERVPVPDYVLKLRPSTLKVLVIAIWVVCLITGLIYWHRQMEHRAALAKLPAITLYYNDGKTVLWDSSEPKSKALAPTFVTFVEAQLQGMYGKGYLSKGKWTVTTSLNRTLQVIAEGEMQDQKASLTAEGTQDGAFIAEDVTSGQIVSWVGTLDPTHNTTGNLTQPVTVGHLQLPFTYATLLQKTTDTADTVFSDMKGPLPGWPCTNSSPMTTSNCLQDSDGQYLGPLTVAQALAKARNVPAVEAASSIGGSSSNSERLSGVNAVLDTTKAMGSDAACYRADSVSLSKQNETQCYLAATIGDGLFATPLSTMGAYATLANSGKKITQHSILTITLSGKTEYRWTAPTGAQTIRQNVAQTITGILANEKASSLQADKAMFTLADGTDTALVASGASAGTQPSTVIGSVQYTPRYAVGVWVMGQKVDPSAQEIVGTLSSTIDTVPISFDWLNAAQ